MKNTTKITTRTMQGEFTHLTWHGGRQGDLDGGTWHGGRQGDLDSGTWHGGRQGDLDGGTWHGITFCRADIAKKMFCYGKCLWCKEISNGGMAVLAGDECHNSDGRKQVVLGSITRHGNRQSNLDSGTWHGSEASDTDARSRDGPLT